MNKFILQEQKFCKLGSKCNEKNKFISIKKKLHSFLILRYLSSSIIIQKIIPAFCQVQSECNGMQ